MVGKDFFFNSAITGEGNYRFSGNTVGSAEFGTDGTAEKHINFFDSDEGPGFDSLPNEKVGVAVTFNDVQAPSEDDVFPNCSEIVAGASPSTSIANLFGDNVINISENASTDSFDVSGVAENIYIEGATNTDTIQATISIDGSDFSTTADISKDDGSWSVSIPYSDPPADNNDFTTITVGNNLLTDDQTGSHQIECPF